MSLAKLTIVILMLAALLFAVAPNLSWGNCIRPRRGPVKIQPERLAPVHPSPILLDFIRFASRRDQSRQRFSIGVYGTGKIAYHINVRVIGDELLGLIRAARYP